MSSDGYKLVSGSDDKNIIVWDVKGGDEIRTLKGHSMRVECVAITPDNKKIVSGSGDKTAKLWDIESGELLHTFEGHREIIKDVAIHDSGEYLATASEDDTWKLWSLAFNKKKLLYTSHDAHTGDVRAISFSPSNQEGEFLYSGSADNTINVEDLGEPLNFTAKR